MGQSLPKSIIVIHGVGDHKEGETARQLALALARVNAQDLNWLPPTFVANRGDIQCASCSEPDAEVFTFGVFDVKVPETGATHRLSVYELYWSRLSRTGEGFLAEVRRAWKFLVGLPRIGYQALFPGPADPDSALYRIARAALCVAWVLAVLRLVAALTSIFMISYLKVLWMRYYDLLLMFDLPLSAALVTLDACLAMILVTRGFEAFRVSCVAALLLGITIVLTQALPLTIAEITGFDVAASLLDLPDVAADLLDHPEKIRAEGFDRAAWVLERPPHRPWYHARDRQGTPPSWPYAINNLTGFAPYFTYGLVVLWAALVMGGLYALATRIPKFTAGASERDEVIRSRVARRLSGVVWLTNFFLLGLTIVVLVVTPSMMLFDFTTVFLLKIGSFLAPWDPDQIGNPVQVLQFLWMYFLSYLFIIILWLIIGSSRVRQEITPALELVHDVSSYFPSIPLLDRYRPVSYLLGGHAGQRELRELADRLKDRLRVIIRYAATEEPNRGDGQARCVSPVAVVGHSLGSVIALSALRDWDGSPPQGAAAPTDGDSVGVKPALQIDLVTMGSPFSRLCRLFPHIFGAGSQKPTEWELPLVRRWLNLYRAADLIGRELDFEPIHQVNPRLITRNENPSNGGHGGYFEDAVIATSLLRWLFSDGSVRG